MLQMLVGCSCFGQLENACCSVLRMVLGTASPGHGLSTPCGVPLWGELKGGCAGDHGLCENANLNVECMRQGRQCVWVCWACALSCVMAAPAVPDCCLQLGVVHMCLQQRGPAHKFIV
jgi:hypothetical protein